MTQKTAHYDIEGPAYNSYPDKGCSLYPSCLTCPTKRCPWEILEEKLAKGDDDGRRTCTEI